MRIEKKYPEGYFKTMWMLASTGVLSAIGVPLGLVLEIPLLIGASPLIGVIIGMLIGEKFEAKYKNRGQIRSLNDKEVRNRKILIIVIFFVGLVGFVYLVFR